MGSGCSASNRQGAAQTVEKSIVPKEEVKEAKEQKEAREAKEQKDQKVETTVVTVGGSTKVETKEIPAPEPEKPQEIIQASDVWKAIENNDIVKLKKILTSTELSPGDLFNPKGQSILHVAALSGNSAAITTILDCNIPTIIPDILNANLATPLHSAIIHDKLEAVKALISYGPDSNIEDEHGQTPMLLCSIHGRKAIAELLIESSTSGKLSEPLNLNAKDRKGLCPLNCSAIKGEYEMCKLLIEKGKANVDEPSHKGCTALIYSARGGYENIVELLIANKTNKQQQDASGATALHHSSEKNFPGVVEMLLKAGADSNIQDLAGRTPLFEAILNGSAKTIPILIANNTDTNIMDYLGRTPLFYAAIEGNEEVVKLLVEKGNSDINLYSMPNQSMEKEMMEKKEDKQNKLQIQALNYARTPIHAAIVCGNNPILEYLIEKGGRVVETGKHNNSSLHIAAYAQNIAAAKILIKAGLDLNLKNLKNIAAIDIFAKSCPSEIQELVELSKAKPEQPIKVYEGEKAEDEEDAELSMRLEENANVDDPRIGAIGAIYGEKVTAALLTTNKRYKGFKWLLKNYTNIGLSTDGVKAALCAVSLGLEERVHKMNVIVLEMMENMIVNATPFITNAVIEELGIIELMIAKAVSATDRLLNRIIDLLPKIGDLPGVGIDYLIQKCMNYLRVVTQPEGEEGQPSKKYKEQNVILQIMLKLIDSFGPDSWPLKEMEQIISAIDAGRNSSLKTNIQQLLVILKESSNDAPIIKKRVGEEEEKEKEEEDKSPFKKPGGGVEEHVIQLQDAIQEVNEKSAEADWEEKYKKLLEVLAEKNLMNFMAAIDICGVFLAKSLKFKRQFIETHIIELLQPILKKIDSSNKRVKSKCRDLVLNFWKTSVINKDWLHTHLATYLTSPEQHKLFNGTIAIFEEILNLIHEKKINNAKMMEEALGVELDKIIKMATNELSNKLQQVRKISLGILVKCSEIAAAQKGSEVSHKIIEAISANLKPLKSAVRDKIVEQLNKGIVDDIKKIFEEKSSSPEKGAAEEDKGLIYAEPLSAELKQQLTPVLQYFTETVVQCLHSQNWASRSAALNKIREELIYTTLGEPGAAVTAEAQRNVNIAGVNTVKSIEAWIPVLKHILEDPVLKIYIDGVDLLKEVIVIFRKYITNKDEVLKIIDPLIVVILAKMGDQKPKIREKSTDFLLNMMKEEQIRPDYLSRKILEQFEQTKGSLSANSLGSTLKITTVCVLQYKITEGNQKELSLYMNLLNTSLKHQLPTVRQLAEELYSAIFSIHGETVNQYLVNQKGAIVKKLQSLTKKETAKTEMGKTGTISLASTGKPSGGASGIAALRNLIESGSDSLLNSEDPAQRIKGLVGVKKYIAKQLGTKEISSDRAHDILDELSMLMRTILNDTNQDVYMEALKLLKFSLDQLLKFLSPFDLQITVNTIISILIPKTIAAQNYKIQIASDKFIISLGNESLIGPIIIIKNVFRLLDKLAGESASFAKSLRMSSSQFGGFGKQGTATAFDMNANMAAVMKYLGVANLVLTHYKTSIAHSKEALDCFCETAVTLTTVYADKAQIKEALSNISREIKAVDVKAFETTMVKKEGEAKVKLIEILNAAAGDHEEQRLMSKQGSRRKFGLTKGMTIETKETTESASILPSVHTSSSQLNKGNEEVKASKQLPSYAKRMSKATEGNGALKQPLPPIAPADKTHSLPPLVLRKNPVEVKKEPLQKPLWMADKGPEESEPKQYFHAKGQFDSGKKENRDDDDDMIIQKASSSQAYKFPK